MCHPESIKGEFSCRLLAHDILVGM
jgi:hypothetical protein